MLTEGSTPPVVFMKYEYDIIKDTMLKPIREKAGLGSPPLQFSTNVSK